ncbi:hypothetical protein D3C81_1722720 [compost metagenome]
MALDCLAIVRTDVTVDTQRFAMALQFEQRGVVDNRATVGDPTLDDQVRLDLPDELLHRHHVLRQLNDRAAHPGKVVAVFVFGRLIEKVTSQALEFLVLTLRDDFGLTLRFEDLNCCLGHLPTSVKNNGSAAQSARGQ